MPEETVTQQPTMYFRWNWEGKLQQKFLVIRHTKENYAEGLVLEGSIGEAYKWIDVPTEGVDPNAN